VSEWKTIDSARKDGTDIHLWVRGSLTPVPGYFISKQYLAREYGDEDYMDEGWYPSCGFLFDLPEVTIDPTHWMPLPEPPQ